MWVSIINVAQYFCGYILSSRRRRQNVKSYYFGSQEPCQDRAKKMNTEHSKV